MPYYTMNCQKADCQHQEDVLMKYDEMKAGVDCPECGDKMLNQICAPLMINDFGSGPRKRAIAPHVGPNTKGTKAYEKKMDDENSLDAYKPSGTFGTGGTKGFAERQTKIEQMDKGKTDFAN